MGAGDLPKTPWRHNSATSYTTYLRRRLASAISSPSNPDGAAGNAAFSPLSIHVALSLVAAGAGGATRDQLVAVLGAEGPGEAENLHALAERVVQLVVADGSVEGGPHVAFADGVFVDTSLPLKASFKEVAVGKYKAETHSVDFQTKVMCPSVRHQLHTCELSYTHGKLHLDYACMYGFQNRNTKFILMRFVFHI